MVCLVQMAAAVAANRRYDPKLPASLFWAPWYPLVFFAVTAAAAVRTAPQGLFGPMGGAGRWRSPAREREEGLGREAA